MRLLAAGLCVIVAFANAGSASGQKASSPDSRLPSTGVDYSGIDAFFRTADILAGDVEPAATQWAALLATPGYRLLAQNGRDIRQEMSVAFRPSRTASRDSLLRTDGDEARAMRHLLRARDERKLVLATQRQLEHSIADTIARGVVAAAHFLPAGATERQAPPFIAFAIFGDDGYSLDGGILLDPLFVHDDGALAILSHEFHHAYLSTLDRRIRPAGAPPSDVQLVAALMALRTEGIADQIDKPYPLPLRTDALAWYPARYNEVYDRTPAILRTIDSLLVAVSADSSKASAAEGARVNSSGRTHTRTERTWHARY